MTQNVHYGPSDGCYLEVVDKGEICAPLAAVFD